MLKLFKKKPYNLQPAIQKYEAIDSLVKAGVIKVNLQECSVVIFPEVWNVYPEKKRTHVLNNLLFYINFGNAATGQRNNYTCLTFSVKDAGIAGAYHNGKITYR